MRVREQIKQEKVQAEKRLWAIIGTVLGLAILSMFYFWEGVPWKKASNTPSIDMIRGTGESTDSFRHSVAQLGTDDQELLEQSIYRLERVGSSAVPSILGVATDATNDPQTRKNAVYALGRLGTVAIASAPELMALLRSPSADMRAVTAAALGKMDATASVPLLAQLLHDEDDWVRKSAIRALEDMSSAEARAVLRKYNDLRK